MFSLIRTNSQNPDFQKLSATFDEFLIDIDGDEKDFFAQYNQIHLDHVVLFYENQIAVACGAFKKYDQDTAELKRMFVLPAYRGKGIANAIITELENWIAAEKISNIILETATKLLPAIALYKKLGYSQIPNYGVYEKVASSFCMQKKI
ncbi:MAG: putative acetyltransferase [Flavobacterium sp.]|jgi:putative acetyltransferase